MHEIYVMKHFCLRIYVTEFSHSSRFLLKQSSSAAVDNIDDILNIDRENPVLKAFT